MKILYAHLDAVGLCNALLLQQAQALLLRQILRLGRGVLAALLHTIPDPVSAFVSCTPCLITSSQGMSIYRCMMLSRSLDSCMLAQVSVLQVIRWHPQGQQCERQDHAGSACCRCAI